MSSVIGAMNRHNTIVYTVLVTIICGDKEADFVNHIVHKVFMIRDGMVNLFKPQHHNCLLMLIIEDAKIAMMIVYYVGRQVLNVTIAKIIQH